MRRLTNIVSAAFAVVLVSGTARGDQGQRPGPETSADGLLRIDRVYFEIAVSTGGEVHFCSPNESADCRRTFHGAGGRAKTVADRHGELPAGGTVAIEMPVSVGSNVGIVRFFAFVQKKDFIALNRPDGRAVTSSAEGIERIDTRYMLVVNVSDPEPGVWKLVIAGQGLYQANATTRKKPETYDDVFFRFIEIGGRPGHWGLFPTKGIPAAGSDAACSATIERDLATVTFTFEDANGLFLETVDLVKEEPPPDSIAMARASGIRRPDDYFGNCRVPRAPFRFVARGVDRDGNAYEQRTTTLMHPND